MYRIGEFSKLTQQTVKTLRYYDEIGLLKPLKVDDLTAYRYYSAEQLPRLNRILALKDLGLSLEQIRKLLDRDLSAEEMRGILRMKQAELELQMTESQERLRRVEDRLRQIEQEGRMPSYEVTIKNVPALRVASVRGKVPTYPAQDILWNELEPWLGRKGIRCAGPCFTLDHNDEYKETDVDVEVCEPVDAPLQEEGRMRIHDLPAEQMASVIHHGAFNAFRGAYQAILEWIEKNGYHISGPSREIYLKAGSPVRQDDPSYVTEIQFPVMKG